MRREGGEASVGRWGGLITDRHCALRISKFRCKLPSSKIRDAGTKMFDDIPRPTCRSVYTVSDKRLRHGGSGYETNYIPGSGSAIRNNSFLPAIQLILFNSWKADPTADPCTQSIQ